MGKILARKPKRPRDASQLAKLIVDLSTGQATEENPDEGKNPAAVALGKLGGAKGGKARTAKLTSEQRVAIARKAARVRWAKNAPSEASVAKRGKRAKVVL